MCVDARSLPVDGILCIPKTGEINSEQIEPMTGESIPGVDCTIGKVIELGSTEVW